MKSFGKLFVKAPFQGCSTFWCIFVVFMKLDSIFKSGKFFSFLTNFGVLHLLGTKESPKKLSNFYGFRGRLKACDLNTNFFHFLRKSSYVTCLFRISSEILCTTYFIQRFLPYATLSLGYYKSQNIANACISHSMKLMKISLWETEV